ncbi:IclR family transcriptional regulator [Falsochrobactrum shanghaiense]|uniref:IclR family transcriptional regulator n=2 Tax=Falsochrobactrum shanghaiense TaxID=2201899 RepID=A0A316JE79_9HYPH|nr:IclR family transcriptional regulator [Falsochrobactrum shanghaiense]
MVQSVAKAFHILQSFDRYNPAMTLSQLAQKADVDISTAQRFTHTLQQLGYLNKNPFNRQYELSIKALDLAYHFTRSSRLVDRAMPILQHLSKQTEETVNLTVLDGHEIVFVTRFLSRHLLNTDVIVGSRLPAFCTAPGRATLSRLPRERVLEILAASELRSYTRDTPTDPERILAMIAETRAAGFATAYEEIYHADASIAAPIVGPNGDVVAAVSVAVTLARYKREDVPERFANLVIAAAHSISVG